MSEFESKIKREMMSRLIKFRAWDKDVKKFADMCAIHIDGYIMASSQTFGGMYDYAPDEMAARIVLQQYTGLKDKNGVEIYEGDIIRSKSMPDSPVEFQRGSFNAVYADGSHDEWEAPLWRYGVEVIGNIYENPELVEAEL